MTGEEDKNYIPEKDANITTILNSSLLLSSLSSL